MIRHFAATAMLTARATQPTKLAYKQCFSMSTVSPLLTRISQPFSTYPKHEVLSMPALSPTMNEGKVVQWLKKEGDEVEPGDVICEIQTDKAVVGFEVQEKGFLAKVSTDDSVLPLGTPLALVVKKKDLVPAFADYTFGQSAPAESKPAAKQEPAPTKTSAPISSSNYPPHEVLKMPALSPTMSEGKVLEWKLKVGDSFDVGDPFCAVETDKAVVDYEATDKGYLAAILAGSETAFQVGDPLAVVTKKKENLEALKNYKISGSASSTATATSESATSNTGTAASSSGNLKASSSQRGLVASPLAKKIASEKGVDLSTLKGSGQGGRIIRQDVQSAEVSTKTTSTAVKTPKIQAPKGTATTAPTIEGDNPYQDIPLSSMRKTIAARLTESKTTIPHYYVQSSVEMGALNAMRSKLNQNAQQNGGKISVNDIIVRAVGLALRDYPTVNSTWNGNSVRQYRHADVSVAVAIEGGLITPIVFKADTLGLLEISRRTKDLARRAREGKLHPNEFTGGTSAISNLGMFGIDSVTSVINPPHSTILGVGRTKKTIVYDEHSTDESKPYRVAEMMELIVSADHRVVDGALAAQWLARVRKYLQDPVQMLL